jgi:geranylgeranyl reductase family protein
MFQLILVGLVALVAYLAFNHINSKPGSVAKGNGKFNDKLNDASAKSRSYYDVAIVGAGPSGSTCGFYMAKAGAHVLLLDKEKFPRDKYCGDAVCKTAIEILIDMKLYPRLVEEDLGHVADSGGFVSPSGLSYVGRSHEELGDIPAAMAIKRTDLDNAIAMAAKAAGADLKEKNTVENATFDKEKGLWTVTTAEGPKYQARVLVCADGAQSKLARKLGIVVGEPQGSCSRAFVEGGTHQFDADGVVFYNKAILPGYAAIFRHPKDELNYCCYLIPGNPEVVNEDLKKWHDYLLNEDEMLKAALGDNYKIEQMRAGVLRLGGVPVSYAEHLLVTGDAAGMIDPMTGEGIHHAMDGGRMAAQTLLECIKQNNYSKEAMAVYQQRWMYAFGSDFKWSENICQFLYKYSIFLDAAALAVQRKGNAFLARWADIMTGRVPKIHLLRPEFVIVITFCFFQLLVEKYVLGKKGQHVATHNATKQDKKKN